MNEQDISSNDLAAQTAKTDPEQPPFSQRLPLPGDELETLSHCHTHIPKRHFLLPIDDTDDCENKSLSFFIHHIYKPGDILHLLHIIHEPSTLHMWTGQIIPPDESAEMDEVEQAKHFVAHRFVKTLLNNDISFKLHVILGSTDSPSIADFIVKKAGDVGAEGIVMAKHRKGKVTKLVMGSVTNEVIKRARQCPVVVVPSQWKAVVY